MSTKENYLWKGYDSTCGLAAKTFRPAKADGLLLARLRQNGVVLLGKTNVPQVRTHTSSHTHSPPTH